MKDISGKDLMNGQLVAFNPPRYKGLIKATVIGFTPLMVRVEYKSNYGVQKTVVSPRDLAIIELV
jgi:hypothetical protein